MREYRQGKGASWVESLLFAFRRKLNARLTSSHIVERATPEECQREGLSRGVISPPLPCKRLFNSTGVYRARCVCACVCISEMHSFFYTHHCGLKSFPHSFIHCLLFRSRNGTKFWHWWNDLKAQSTKMLSIDSVRINSNAESMKCFELIQRISFWNTNLTVA